MAEAIALASLIEGLKILPEVVEIANNIWRKLDKKFGVMEGVLEEESGYKFYSKQQGFTISWPKEYWKFWKPTPEFLAGAGFPIMPLWSMPVMLFSDLIHKGFHPNVNVTVEDVGPLMNVHEIVRISVAHYKKLGIDIDDDDVKIFADKNSGVISLRSQSPIGDEILQLQKIHLYNHRAYIITASQVPLSESGEALFGDLQQIVNSFALIKA